MLAAAHGGHPQSWLNTPSHTALPTAAPNTTEYDGTEYEALPVDDARCTVLLSLSSPTDAGLCVSYVWVSRHVTEPSERVGPRSSVIGYVAKGWVAAF